MRCYRCLSCIDDRRKLVPTPRSDPFHPSPLPSLEESKSIRRLLEGEAADAREPWTLEPLETSRRVLPHFCRAPCSHVQPFFRVGGGRSARHPAEGGRGIRVGLKAFFELCEAEQLHFPVGLPPKPELLHPELGPFDP